MSEEALQAATDTSDQRIGDILPSDTSPDRSRIVVPALEDAAEQAWAAGLGREWAAELSNVQEDVYTIDDGDAVEVPTRWDLLLSCLSGLVMLIHLFGANPTRIALVVGVLCGPIVVVFVVWGLRCAMHNLRGHHTPAR